MIYQQHSAEADVPVTKEAAPPAGSSSCFCSYAEAVATAVDSADLAAATAAASSGSCCFSAAAATAVDSAETVAVAAAAAVAAKDS